MITSKQKPRDLNIDSTLRKDAPFRRYASLTEAGLDIPGLLATVTPEYDKLFNEYSAKIRRLMLPHFKINEFARNSHGPFINLDEALEGVPECYRRSFQRKRAPLKIGINISREHDTTEIVAYRMAASAVLVSLCKSRGQNTILELCYGNGKTMPKLSQCHVRINVAAYGPNILKAFASPDLLRAVGNTLVKDLAPDKEWYGFYRFYEFPWTEYDFVLDRIDTNDLEREKKRINEQLLAFGVM